MPTLRRLSQGQAIHYRRRTLTVTESTFRFERVETCGLVLTFSLRRQFNLIKIKKMWLNTRFADTITICFVKKLWCHEYWSFLIFLERKVNG